MDISGLCASRGTRRLGVLSPSDSNLVIACPSKERSLTKRNKSVHKGALIDILILDICKQEGDVGVPK